MKDIVTRPHDLLTQKIKKIDSKSTICSKRYAKITPELRHHFIHLIIQQNFTIKNAAKALNINYSSAKTIFTNYKASLKNISITATLQSGFKDKNTTQPCVKIIYTIGGKYEGQTKQMIRIDQLVSPYLMF